MNHSEFNVKYTEYIDDFISYSESVFKNVTSPNGLADAMKYSFFAGGKRIRPVLTLAFGDCLGVGSDKLLPFAFGLECIHTYSLIHDDLPCMDNDVLRRGKPTCHVRFDEATALLAGDALLNFAFEHVLSKISTKREIEALGYLAGCSGVNGMLSGQQSDKENEGVKDKDENNLLYTYRMKTGKLLTAPFVIPAILKGDKAIVPIAEEIGAEFGQAFQFADDLKDVLMSSSETGKTSGKDIKEEKLTSVSVYGIEETKKKIANLIDNVKSLSEKFDKTEFLQKIFETVIK